ncbi:MAG: VOC family protein [Coprobacillus sp.]
MKYCGSLYVVDDATKTKDFYKELFGLRVIQDFGANFTLTGGISFQTRESWKEFIHKKDEDIVYKGNDAELYFETDDLDGFIEKLKSYDIEYVHDLQVHEWGQRGIRFYDPDKHILEVGETLKQVCQRLLDQGMTIEEVSKKTMLSIKMIERILQRGS